jgi:hypothetical protein
MSTEQQNEETIQSQESQGLGDTIAKLTAATGLDKLVEELAHSMGKEDCGCNKRRRKLNDLFPYKVSK